MSVEHHDDDLCWHSEASGKLSLPALSPSTCSVLAEMSLPFVCIEKEHRCVNHKTLAECAHGKRCRLISVSAINKLEELHLPYSKRTTSERDASSSACSLLQTTKKNTFFATLCSCFTELRVSGFSPVIENRRQGSQLGLVCIEGDSMYGTRQGLVCMEGDKDLCVWKETRICVEGDSVYGRRQGFVWKETRICVEGDKDLCGRRQGFVWKETRICVEGDKDLCGRRQGLACLEGDKDLRVWKETVCIEGDKGLVCMAGDKDLCLWKVCVWKETVYGRRQGLVHMEGGKWNYTVRIIEWVVMEIMRLS